LVHLHNPDVPSLTLGRTRGAGCSSVTHAAENARSVIRVVIAEDQALVRRETVLLLSMAPDMECVGQASNGDEAVKLALVLRPDVVLMGLHMPVKNGVAATREITLAQPSTQVLVLTTLDDDETLFEAVRAGAQAYLLKDAGEDELLEAIRASRRGESRLTPQIARKVMDQFRRLAPPNRSSPSPNSKSDEHLEAAPLTNAGEPTSEGLSDKEETILRHITEGDGNRQIAQAMSLAEGTIKNYVSRIMEKLHANTRTELAGVTSKLRRDA
jgi:DNA-binding NarL/FixJ family response regulator